eukprot:jgi/Ulvmu1/3367/UM156_0024.1
MSVYVETSAGDVVVDLFTDECPQACKNFLKLCKMKYYHNCLFFKISRNFIAQTGDPQNDGSGGTSIYGLLNGPSQRCFNDEIFPELKHNSAGMLGMATGKANSNASQFYVTLAPGLDSLDAKHTLFGKIAEDEDGMVEKLNAAIVDGKERPLQNIRIRRTVVLDDPFPDLDGMDAAMPEQSPEPIYEVGDRLEEDWKPANDKRSDAEVEADLESQKAKNRKVLLEMIGDRPHADAKAPEEFLFVCKLNPVTTEDDLETLFARFGEVIACDIIRDKKTGDSLNYAFIGFAEKKSAEEAYLKLNNALIDGRRIKVDFSQSMYHQWKEYRRFSTERGPQPVHSSRPAEGILLAGGKFKLKSGAHGEGVGASLGLMGNRQGHGQKRRRDASPGERVHGRQGQRSEDIPHVTDASDHDRRHRLHNQDNVHLSSRIEKTGHHRRRGGGFDRDITCDDRQQDWSTHRASQRTGLDGRHSESRSHEVRRLYEHDSDRRRKW